MGSFPLRVGGERTSIGSVLVRVQGRDGPFRRSSASKRSATLDVNLVPPDRDRHHVREEIMDIAIIVGVAIALGAGIFFGPLASRKKKK